MNSKTSRSESSFVTATFETVDPYVQSMIAATNGRMYIPLIGKLKDYPIPTIPVDTHKDALLLDIGCGWGRWMVSAARKGYIPVGIDIKLDAVKASRRVLTDLNLRGYFVVADLKKLPFKSEIFDVVWSYSAIQHTHRKHAQRCIEDVHRVMSPGGFCKLEFPMKYGVWNILSRLGRIEDPEDYDSWCVRYYSVRELKEIFVHQFSNFKYSNHCYLGIGIQPEDLSFVPWTQKLLVLGSIVLTGFSRILPPLKLISDSVYVRAQKNEDQRLRSSRILSDDFRKMHSQSTVTSNLAILDLLRCPVSGGELEFDETRCELVSQRAGLSYPIEQDIPILLEERARRL